MIHCIEHKLYMSRSQADTISRWLSLCCWLYNRCLDHRIKAYRRRKESANYYAQQSMLTQWRGRIERLRLCPVAFERDALRRVDRGMKAFFRRVRAGERPGFPRFRSGRRYNSIECLAQSTYMIDGRVKIPCLGVVRSRGRAVPAGTQKGLRIVRRPSGWYAQVLIDDGKDAPEKRPVESAIGVDVGLSAFATMSDGSKIENPRWLNRSARKLRHLQRRASRRRKGSNRRRKAVKRLARHHERIVAQRRNFCHRHSTDLVRTYDLIAVEKLNVSGMVRGRFGKSILDAAWSQFTAMVDRKAEYAGVRYIAVNPRGTSQECPKCGEVKPKKLSERVHECQTCGFRCDRDHAAARVILARARNVHSGTLTPVEASTSGCSLVASCQADPVKREDFRSAPVRCAK